MAAIIAKRMSVSMLPVLMPFATAWLTASSGAGPRLHLAPYLTALSMTSLGTTEAPCVTRVYSLLT